MQQLACPGLDECLPIGERGLDIVGERLGRRWDESSDSRPGSFTGPQLLRGLVEHVGQLRGGVGLVVARPEPRCELGERDRGEIADRLVTRRCALQGLVVGAGEHAVGQVLGERCDVEQRGPTVDLRFAGEHVVLGQQCGQRGVTVYLERESFEGGQVGVAAREHLGESVCQGQRLGLVEMLSTSCGSGTIT
ncbi:hypothetical protein [Nesterenkonia massiliensis]|uniref:hypothetical protein n=1 Tax=Nesterenkonia massiliensis TaxID=1232429 RepID=UPI003B8A6D89